MCRVYGKQHAFIRLCYRFGPRRGEKIFFEGEPPLQHGHYHGERGGQRGKSKVFALTFQIPPHTLQAAIDDMARYAHARATLVEGGLVTLSRTEGWKAVESIIERARTFGWKKVDE